MEAVFVSAGAYFEQYIGACRIKVAMLSLYKFS
jgi:hypothetical protein